MRCLLDRLMTLEESLRLDCKTVTADFFRSLLNEIESGDRNSVDRALKRLAGSSAITQYANFTSEQEALFLEIAREASVVRDLH